MDAVSTNDSSVDPDKGAIVVEPENQSGYMKGFPPPPGKQVHGFSLDWILDPEQSRWSMMNMSKIVHVGAVSRGSRPIYYFPRNDQPLLDNLISDIDGVSMSLRQLLKISEVDGFIALKNGEIIVEAYYNGYRPGMRHEMMSVTKSLVGTLLGVLVEEGVLREHDPVAGYLPEMAESGWGDATLRQVLDMTAGAAWQEDMSHEQTHLIQATAAVGMQHARTDYRYKNGFELICDVKGKDFEHGEKYDYRSGHTEVLSWVISRVCQNHWQDVFAEKIWSKLGAEHDGMVIVDTTGQGASHAGFNGTLRDMARFAVMMANHGYFNHQQIVPESWVKDIYNGDGNSRQAWSRSAEAEVYNDAIFYRSQFRVIDSEKGIYFGLGAKGQLLYVNSAERLVGIFQSTIAGVDEESDRRMRARQLAVMKDIDLRTR
jgi:CubicO group peptidase (beta-lactamase class C family)